MTETAPPRTVIQTDGLCLGYGPTVVLRDVNWRVDRGAFWFLAGPNGAGKTTLLRAVLGDLPPRAGSLRLDPALADRRTLGYVPQRCELNPALPTTVAEFVSLGLVRIRCTRAERRRRLAEALDAVDMAGTQRRGYWSLSGGQRQRALLARALIRRPRWLILDEPTAGVDLATAEALLELLARINRRDRLTILFVAHDLTLAARFATHVALFGHGRVHAGPADDILTPQHLRAAYGVPIRVTREAEGVASVRVGDGRAPPEAAAAAVPVSGNPPRGGRP